MSLSHSFSYSQYKIESNKPGGAYFKQATIFFPRSSLTSIEVKKLTRHISLMFRYFCRMSTPGASTKPLAKSKKAFPVSVIFTCWEKVVDDCTEVPGGGSASVCFTFAFFCNRTRKQGRAFWKQQKRIHHFPISPNWTEPAEKRMQQNRVKETTTLRFFPSSYFPLLINSVPSQVFNERGGGKRRRRRRRSGA